MEPHWYRAFQLLGYLVSIAYFAHNYFNALGQNKFWRYKNFLAIFQDHANLPFSLWTVYFTKRSLQTLFIHQFSRKGCRNVELYDHFLGYTFLWGFTGAISLQAAKQTYHTPDMRVVVAFLGLNALSLHFHNQLALLRRSSACSKNQEQRYLIRKEKGEILRILMCPHYVVEMGIWTAFMVICPVVEVLIYLCVVIAMLLFRSYQKRQYFIQKYPQLFKTPKLIHRSAVLIPFLF